MLIDVILFDGVDELDALGPYEVFANAGLDVALVALEGARAVTGSHAATVLATAAPRPDAALLVVPGGGWIDRSAQGAWAQAQDGALPAAIAAAHARGAIVAGVCTGVMLLAAAGVLRECAAVTHAGALGDLRAQGVPVHPEARVVDAGRVLTCGGVTSGLDLALHLVRRECGAAAAARVAREMEHELRGPVVRAAGKTPVR